MMRYDELLFEMANLQSDETGLPFMIWISPRGKAKYDVRVKASIPPYGAHPIAIYSVRPFELVAGKDWLSSEQSERLHEWISLNERVLVDFWENRILSDKEVRNNLRALDNAPPANRLEAVIALRASAPKVIEIQWDKGMYHLIFDKFLPNADKVAFRFHEFGFDEPISLDKIRNPSAITLWKKSPMKPLEPTTKRIAKQNITGRK